MSQKTYRIGEAAAKLNLKSYVLRFWETEFSQIAPIRTEKGQRLYTESDLAVLSRIRFLLHERGLTIDGARRLLREEAAKGTLYKTTDMLLPENGPSGLPGSLPGAAQNDLQDEDPDGPEEEDLSPSPLLTGGPVQASLFTPGGGSGKPASLPGLSSEVAPAFSEDDLRDIVTELAAIHHLLVFETPGDIP